MNANIAAIHAVRDAATRLTLVCTEIVGPLEMIIAMPTTPTLGEELPRAISKLADRIDEKERKQ